MDIKTARQANEMIAEIDKHTKQIAELETGHRFDKATIKYAPLGKDGEADRTLIIKNEIWSLDEIMKSYKEKLEYRIGELTFKINQL